MISFTNIFVKYTKEFFALSNINLNIDDGEIVALLGPVDSGKTCFLRLLAQLEKQDKGEIYINDIPLYKIDFKEDLSLGYIPYKTNFFEKKTVYENLKYVLKIRRTPNEQIEEKINNVIIEFKLENILNEKIYKLNLFQKYLVSIARLSFRKLDVLLIDNIFDDLSKEENKELLKIIKKYLINKKTTVLFATSQEKIAKSFATRIVKLEYGAINGDERVNKKTGEK